MSSLEKGWNTYLTDILVVLIHILFMSMIFVAACTVQQA